MQETDRVSAIFADAWGLYAEAIEILEMGKQRIAEEVAWGATKRATDALILARLSQEPGVAGRTSGALRSLSRSDGAVALLLDGYNSRARYLHGACFYLGDCSPENERVQDIRETADYIREAERLAVN